MVEFSEVWASLVDRINFFNSNFSRFFVELKVLEISN